MGLSFHIVVPLFLAFALADIALLSIRALLSYQRHSLTLLYALMGVQEAMLLFELLATFAPLFATFLITAGMWGHIARLYAVFFPLWVLRTFFAAFTMVYKNILIPRWTAALREQLRAGAVLNAPGIRAWHAGGYGACVVLDVVCCCLYYLTAVYVLGYLSDKTLYVPYHRRRWRHEQMVRAHATTAAQAAAMERRADTVAEKAVQSPSAGTSISSLPRQHTKRQREDDGGEQSSAADKRPPHRHRHPSHTVLSLARMPSFAQWQHAPASASPGNGDTNDNTAVLEEGGQGRSALPHFSSMPSVAVGQEGEDHTDHVHGPRSTAPAATQAARPVFTATAATPSTQHAAVQPISNAGAVAAQHRGGASPLGAAPLRSKPPAAFLSDLPPLQLSRRFTLSTEGEEGNLNQFAAALVEHGFSTQASEKPVSAHGGAPPLHSRSVTQRGPLASNSTTAVLQGDEDGSPGMNTTTLVTAGASTAAPSTTQHSSTSNSGTDTSVLLQRPSGGTEREKGSGRSSFRRMLSAWSGFKASSAGHDGGTAEQPQHQHQGPPQTGTRRVSLDDHVADAAAALPRPPPRRRSTSLVRFALDGSGSGSGDAREDAAAAPAAETPPLPPRPRPSFRIDHATGNVVPVVHNGK